MSMPPRAVSYDQLDWLRMMFRSASCEPGKLFHVMRVAAAPGPARPHADDHKHGWEAFRPGVPVFNTAAYTHRYAGTQHTAYHGDRGRLDEYTGLAARAYEQLPINWTSLSKAEAEPDFARDAWTRGIYHFAWEHRTAMPVDVVGESGGLYAAQAQPAQKDLMRFVCDAGDITDLRGAVVQWRSGCKAAGLDVRHAYARLALDAFAASYLLLDFTLKNFHDLFHNKEFRVLADYTVFAEELIADAALWQKVAYLVKVNLRTDQIQIGKRLVKVSPKEALFFHCLAAAKGGPISSSEMKDIAKRDGQPTEGFRPERVRAGLEGLPALIVKQSDEANRKRPYELTFDNVTQADLELPPRKPPEVPRRAMPRPVRSNMWAQT